MPANPDELSGFGVSGTVQGTCTISATPLTFGAYSGQVADAPSTLSIGTQRGGRAGRLVRAARLALRACHAAGDGFLRPDHAMNDA